MEVVLSQLDIELGRLRAFGLRMRVWWAKDRLTGDLASGAASVDSRQLALRAGQLTAKHTLVLLLTDVERPLFGIGTPDDLSAAIIHASERLEP